MSVMCSVAVLSLMTPGALADEVSAGALDAAVVVVLAPAPGVPELLLEELQPARASIAVKAATLTCRVFTRSSCRHCGVAAVLAIVV
jgi:hypothetical protein